MSDFTSIPINELPFNKLNITVVAEKTVTADLLITTATEDCITASEGELKAFADFSGFKGAVGATAHSFGNGKATALLGLGKITADAHHNTFAKIGAGLATLVSSTKSKIASLHLTKEIPSSVARVIFETFFFQLYVDNRFRSESKPLEFNTLEIVYSHGATGLQSAVEEAKKLAAGTFFTRDLVNAPANYCHPESMADALETFAKENGLEAKILDRKTCEEYGMGCFIAVGKGSIHQPKFVHLTYRPKEVRGDLVKIVFIGKGVTFDTGGYNIKVAMMELMKFDMGGAGAVFGAAKAIAGLAPEGVEVHFISALADNAVSCDAFRPGDILTAANGKTVEVLNTDAEGRLTMADALVYAEKEIAPVAIVELSTLTGAQLIALGPKVAALMCKTESLTDDIKAAAKLAGENVWELPLFEEYKEGLKSKIADIANLDASRNAGTISAGLFLNEFVKNTPYAHIDIAGPTWDFGKGSATAYGARLLTVLVENFSKKATKTA